MPHSPTLAPGDRGRGAPEVEDALVASRSGPRLAGRRLAPIVILGGGPAGCACALWLSNYGHRPLLIDAAPVLGGLQARSPYPNGWMLGQPAVLSQDLAARFADHVALTGVPVARQTRCRALSVVPGQPWPFTLELEAAGQPEPIQLGCHSLVLATGTEFRGRAEAACIDGYPSVASLVAHDPIEAAVIGPLQARRLLIVGGGDNAFEAAVTAVQAGQQVVMLVRGAVRAQAQFQARLQPALTTGQAQILVGTSLTRLEAAPPGLRAEVAVEGAGPQVIAADRLLYMIGYRPAHTAIEWRGPRPQVDDQGHLVIDGDGRTMISGLYAAGDCANPRHPCVATAIAAGTVVARTLEMQLRATPPIDADMLPDAGPLSTPDDPADHAARSRRSRDDPAP